MLKRILFAAFVAATLAPAVTPVVAAPASVYIRIGPPPPRAEAVPRARRGYDWSPGYWNWNNRRQRHHWVAGSWMRSRQGYVYAQPSWVERNGRWEQRRGTWARRDQDRDGIPNARDRDRDGVGIPNARDRDRDGDGVPNRRDQAPNNPRRD